MTHVEIITGRICPYCGGKPELMDSAAIYGKSYGPVWACLPCDAYVGVHKGTDKPLGRLANADLRSWKKKAHAVFDPLWKKKISQGATKYNARSGAYAWLATEMNLSCERCHIGMFDVAECRQVIEICQSLYQNKTTPNV